MSFAMMMIAGVCAGACILEYTEPSISSHDDFGSL